MTTKEYLSQAYRIDKRINIKIEQLKSLRELATKATSTLSDTCVSGPKNKQCMERIIVKMVDLENEINADIDELITLKAEITSKIKQVENPEYRMLLELRYLCFSKWEDIAEEMNYELRYLYKLHNQALISCGKKLDTKRH